MADTAVATTGKPHPLVQLRTYLYDRVNSLKDALPPHISPERFISSVMTAVQINPDLMACDRRTLWIACMRAAQDGLLPDGTEAAIVPYKDKANYLPMYQGLIKKFRNSGQFKWIAAGIAYEGEEYSHWIDETGEHFKHVPSAEGDNRKIKRVYAVATTKDGGFFISDMSLADVNKRRAMSRASRDDAPWKVWPDEMMKKTALRVLSKLLPKSSDIDAFMARDEQESLGVAAAEVISDRRSEAIGNVMDHFAGGGEGEAETKEAAKEETKQSATAAGEPTTASAAASGAGQSPTSATDSMPPSEGGAGSASTASVAPDGDAVAAAYKKGQEAKAAGLQRKALPGEYRDPAHQREAVAWQAGFDGAPMPTFGEKP